jgi:uncharacterized membrane protein (DUF2068 family)
VAGQGLGLLAGLPDRLLYLPFDIFAIIRHPGWPSWTILAINLIVVYVLARDLRKRHR